jgi:hypothetical protein
MRTSLVLSVVLVFVLVTSAFADFTLVRTIPSPGGEHLSGLDNADGVLFAVVGHGTGESCLMRIDPADGEALAVECLTSQPPGCPGAGPDYVSCAFQPWNSLAEQGSEDPLCMDAYWVGDACGDLIKYNWTDTYGLVYAGHCKPQGIGEPAGLAVLNDFVYVLDRTNRCVFKLTDCFDAPPDPCYLPGDIANPSALAVHGGDFFVSDAGTDLVYEISQGCALVGVHRLEDFAPRVLAGMTFIGDYLFVASDCDEILVYEFGSGGFEVPEGDSVVVDVLPDELEIVFPTVSDSGSLYVHVDEVDPCPPPEGVRFLPSFYEVLTTASFEYVARVAIMAEEPMPEDVNPRRVRIFRRPSGECMPYMDVTVAPFQILETERSAPLARLSKRLSEDDEFSVFILGEDMRHPLDVVNLKFMYLQQAIDAVGGVPVDPINLMNSLKADAMAATAGRRYGVAARLVDRIADVAMATPEIPHTYDPDNPGANLGGRIVARAHTLSFSLRQLMEERVLVGPPGLLMSGTPRGEGGLEVSANPSTSGFSMAFSPCGTSPVSLRIYSVGGRLVRTLLEGATPEGRMTATWDGTNGAGVRVATGTYFAVMSQGDETSVKKLVLRN